MKRETFVLLAVLIRPVGQRKGIQKLVFLGQRCSDAGLTLEAKASELAKLPPRKQLLASFSALSCDNFIRPRFTSVPNTTPKPTGLTPR